MNPIPVSIRNTATTRPPVDAGEMSPYPTVVAVTSAHQIASLNPIFSKCPIATAPRRMVETVKKRT